MELLQLYYTSCKKGRAPGHGFQFYSASDGLTEEEIKELERICLYIPPNSLPTQPTHEQIEKDFPVSFSYFRLNSGRYGVSQSVYIGKDYSGRYGNYFSHAFVLKEGEWPFSPIFLYGSPIFRKNLTNEELEIKRIPEPLPVIKVEKPNGPLTEVEVQQFFKVGNRYELLKRMLNGIIQRNGKPESIILGGKLEDIPFWIAAIHLSFPLKIAKRLTFSTYVYDPNREDYVISVIIDEGTRVSFKHVARRSSIYCFDFERNEFSEVEYLYRYPNYVVKNQLDMERFRTFFQGFKEVEMKELDAAYDLFTLVEEHSWKMEPSRVQEAIAFCSTYGSKEVAVQVLEKLPIEQLILSANDIQAANIISDFLIGICNITKNDLHVEKIVIFLLETVKDFVIDDVDLTNIQIYLNKKVEKLAESKKVSEEFLKTENLLSLQKQLKQMADPRKELFYLQLMIDFVRVETMKWQHLLNEHKQFIFDLAMGQVKNGDTEIHKWQFITHDPEFFAGFIVDLYVFNKSIERERATTLQLFIAILEEKSSDTIWLENCLHEMSQRLEATPMLSEWEKHQFKKGTDHPKTWQENEEETENHRSNLNENDRSKYLVEIFHKKTVRNQELENILSHTKIEEILTNKDHLLKIYRLCHSHLSFSNLEMNSYLPVYKKIIEYYYGLEQLKVAVSLELAVMTFEVFHKENGSMKQLEDFLNVYASEIMNTQLLDYFLWCFPEIYDQKRGTKTLAKKLIRKWPTVALQVLKDRGKDSNWKFSPEVFVDVYEVLVITKEEKKERETIVQYLLENADDLKKINDIIKTKRNINRKWELLYKEVQSQQGNSIVRSLKKIFGAKG